MRKITILLILLILLQGCVSPKTGQLSIPLPKDISYPSALVIKDKYLGVLSMEGKFDPRYKVDGNLVNNPKKMVDVQNKKSVNFLIKTKSSLFSTYSLWDMDFPTNSLYCLIPSLKNVRDDWWTWLTPDKNYFEFPFAYLYKSIHISRPYHLNYDGFFCDTKLYSINNKSILQPPEIKGLEFSFFRTGSQPDILLLVYKNKKNPKDLSQILYIWNIKKNALKRIQFPELKTLKINYYQVENFDDPNFIIIQVSQFGNKIDKDTNSPELIYSLFKININNLLAKHLFTTSSCNVRYSKEFNWLLFTENNTLFRYDVLLGKKEILKHYAGYLDYEILKDKSILITIENPTDILDLISGKTKTFKITQLFFLLNPKGQWIHINDLFLNGTIQSVLPFSDHSFLLSIQTASNGTCYVIKWNSSTNVRESILEDKKCINIQIENVDDISTSEYFNLYVYAAKQTGHYFKIIVKINEDEDQAYIYNSITKEVKYIPVLCQRNRQISATQQYLWIYESTHSYFADRIFLLDWNDPSNSKPKIEFSKKTFSKSRYDLLTLSPDRNYIPIVEHNNDANSRSENRLWFVNILTGNELSFPESKDFQFITWLEEK